MEEVAFYTFATIAVVSSLLVVGQRNPMYSVMLLIASFGALAGLYVMLDSPFIAVAQIIIYAGAIMVLFLFVVMLLNVSKEDATAAEVTRRPVAIRVGAGLAVLLAFQLAWALSHLGLSFFGRDPESVAVSSVARIGTALFTTHAFAFEATSILILAAMVGAVVLARRGR